MIETLLVVDQGIPRDVASLLRRRGYSCLHVGEVGMSAKGDAEILKWSLEQNAMVITLDADFHTILAVSGASRPSVIRVRIEGLGALAMSGILEEALTELESALIEGSLVTIKARKTTCHRLPVGGTK